MGELVAECLGTFVLITLGDGVVAMVVLFGTGEPQAGLIAFLTRRKTNDER